jgi:hypothetical protein
VAIKTTLIAIHKNPKTKWLPFSVVEIVLFSGKQKKIGPVSQQILPHTY